MQTNRPPSGTIRSIQLGTITITAGNSSNTATITSVDTTKSIIHFLGVSNPTGSGNGGYVTLTNATTVTANRSDTTNQTIYGFQVVEYY